MKLNFWCKQYADQDQCLIRINLTRNYCSYLIVINSTGSFVEEMISFRVGAVFLKKKSVFV